MARLSYAQRNKMPASEFTFPSKAPGGGSYPVPDKARGRSALQRVSQFGSSSEKAAVRAKVARKFPGIKQGK